jgi:hypothetical protein
MRGSRKTHCANVKQKRLKTALNSTIQTASYFDALHAAWMLALRAVQTARG